MAPNVRNAENAILNGMSRVDEWFHNFELNWNKPEVDTAIAMVVKRLPPEVKANLPQKALNQIKERLGRQEE
jgi:hypothetical protein